MNLQIDRHENFRKREHRLTQLGGIVMVTVVVAGAAGLLGLGPLSASVARSPGGVVSVEYHRVGHLEADADLIVIVTPEAVVDGTLEIELTGPWVGGAAWDSITPSPARETLVPGGVRMEFPAAGDGELEVTLTYRAAEPWSLPLTVTAGGESAELTQFVLP